jgi:hypothetical protein
MRRRHWAPVLPLIMLLAMPLAGCGGSDGGSDGVASAGGGAVAGSTASAEPVGDDERRLKFAECMRENGIDMPDPEPGGGGMVRLGDGVDPQKARAAMEQCREHLPNGGESRQLDPEQLENLRKMAQCMRDNGVEDFPDPPADGVIQFGGGDRNIDPNDPTVRAALQKCQQYLPRMRASAGATG